MVKKTNRNVVYRRLYSCRQQVRAITRLPNIFSVCSRPLLLRISSAHAIHWSRTCHVIFKRAHRVENSTKYRADDLCVNLVCEYFCWMLGDPHFFFGRSLPFLALSIILKNRKNLCVGSFNYFSYTIKKGSNW